METIRHTWAYIQAQALKSSGNTCENCGRYRPGWSHIILKAVPLDGDENNTDESNIIVLCPRCQIDYRLDRTSVSRDQLRLI